MAKFNEFIKKEVWSLIEVLVSSVLGTSGVD